MTETPSQEANSSLETARVNSGMYDPTDPGLHDMGNESEEKPEVKLGEESTHESDEDEGNDEDPSKDEEGEEDKDKPTQSRKARPTNQSQSRAIFAQIKEQNKAIKGAIDAIAAIQQQIVTPKVENSQNSEQQLATEKIRAFATSLAEKQGLDPEGLTELVEGIVKMTTELTPKEKHELPQDVKDTLDLAKKLGAESEAAVTQMQQIQAFDTEWNDFKTVLMKQHPEYRYASETEFNDAKAIMFEVSHSAKGGIVIDEKNGILHGHPLDYLLFKDVDGLKSKFDTILKVAPKRRGSESAEGKDIVDDIDLDEEDIDMDPETMTPEKYRRREKQRMRQAAQDKQSAQMIG